MALASRGPEVRHVVWNGTLTMVILALAVAGARQEPQRLAWLLRATTEARSANGGPLAVVVTSRQRAETHRCR
jgi:hypothetical protein